MAERKIGDKVLRLVRGDITDMDVQAFVFDITEDAKLGSGYGGAIQQRGGIVIQKELDEIGSVPKGTAVMTEAGILKAERIIHVNGPKFREEGEEEMLRRTTTAALALAEEKGISQIAFPPIGTGLYQVPLDLCARVMVQTISEHLESTSSVKEVLLVALDNREHVPLEAAISKGA
jgi:O-acetyl-ADP-ribose deacetylase (regulator of RNase III)